MKKWPWILLAAGGVYLLWRASKAVPPPVTVKLKEPLPAGAVTTGKTQETTNGRPPNYIGETVGYGVRYWAEVKYPDGHLDWVEIDKP